MHGHTGSITQANSGAFLILCECGWISDAWPVPGTKNDRTGRISRHPDVARNAALDQHSRHVSMARGCVTG